MPHSPAQVRARMVDRVWFVGSNAETAPQIEAGFPEMLGSAGQSSRDPPYLFGGRPAFGDFGLWGQIYEMWTDPTAGALIGGGAPACARLGASHAVAAGRRHVRNLARRWH